MTDDELILLFLLGFGFDDDTNDSYETSLVDIDKTLTLLSNLIALTGDFQAKSLKYTSYYIYELVET